MYVCATVLEAGSKQYIRPLLPEEYTFPSEPHNTARGTLLQLLSGPEYDFSASHSPYDVNFAFSISYSKNTASGYECRFCSQLFLISLMLISSQKQTAPPLFLSLSGSRQFLTCAALSNFVCHVSHKLRNSPSRFGRRNVAGCQFLLFITIKAT